MKRVLKYILHRPTWHKLPVLPRQYATDYDPALVDEDTATVMRLAHVRCPQGVEKVRRRHGARDTAELAAMLSWRHRPRYLKARALSMARTALGLTAYDPMKEIARQHRRKGRR